MIKRALNFIRREFLPLKNVESKKGILFLTYHSVSRDFDSYPYNTHPDSLLDQVAFLRRYFKIISMDEASDQMRNGVKHSGQVVITFDDGYSSVYDFVFPAIKRLGVPFTLFVTTSLISSGYVSYCNWAQICEMSSHDLVTIGSHGVNHLDFESIHKVDVEKEITDSKQIIESQIGKPVSVSCLPAWPEQQGGFGRLFKSVQHIVH